MATSWGFKILASRKLTGVKLDLNIYEGINLVGKRASVIDINGVRYDAGTGDVITKVKNFAKLKAVSGSQVIDGFIKAKNKQIEPKSEAKTAKTEVQKKVRRAHSLKSSAKNIHHRTERSRTLVRSMVVKPSLRVREASKSFARPTFKTDDSSLDKNKLGRAAKIAKNSKVDRFGTPKVRDVVDSGAAMGEVITRPHKIPARSASKTANAAIMPSMVTSASHQQLERLLDVALHTASSHRESYKNSRVGLYGKLTRMPRWVKIAIVFVVVLAALAFIVWRNMPSVAVKIAGLKASVNTSIPTYTPVGYSYSGATAGSNNEVHINYQDNQNNSNVYKITEKKTSMDSTALGSSPIVTNNQVQTTNVNGNSVYIYGPTNDVTWVNQGVQYTIENKAGLPSDQLVSIVQSIQ